jgi:quinol monooxygenase YgiN
MHRFVLSVGIAVVAALAAPIQAQEQAKAPMGGFPDLVGGLKATPGCLGVETARTAGGKNVIFAWFEDKKAALRWYSSEMHQQVMKLAGPLPENHPAPLAGVAADSGPIMVIASLTMNPAAAKDSPLPVSQIAIELYQPLPGGAFVGGRFAPATVKVPGMRGGAPHESSKP